MDTEGSSLEDALATAQELGYAEADPTADVEGYDAAQKAAILASLAFHTTVPLDAVHREGILGVTRDQVVAAKKSGFVVKLLAVCERLVDPVTGVEGVSARVHPALIPATHPLAAVHGANNAVFLEAEAAGSLMFYGAGAGGIQTASAVLGDVVSAARRHVIGGPGVAESTHANLAVLPIASVTTRYQITLQVLDRPGVLAEIASVFSTHEVSVEAVPQSVATEPEHVHEAGTEAPAPTATLVIGTHEATEAALADTVAALKASEVVAEVTSVLRVEGL